MATRDASDIIEILPCLPHLGPDGKRRLLDQARELSFAKGEIIMLEGEPCSGFFAVESGAVRLYRSSPQGREQVVRVVRRGECLDCAPLFDRGSNPVSAQAIEKSNVVLIPAAHFHSIIDSYPPALLDVVRCMAERLRSLLNIVGDISFLGVRTRLAKLLYQLSREKNRASGGAPLEPVNQDQLARILGCSRQMVNSCLRKLVKDGVISMEGHSIIVSNREALRRISDQAHLEQAQE